jgi:hypothetical protein
MDTPTSWLVAFKNSSLNNSPFVIENKQKIIIKKKITYSLKLLRNLNKNYYFRYAASSSFALHTKTEYFSCLSAQT